MTSFYGLRISEVLGLKWSNIDFENKVIVLKHKVIEVKSGIKGKDRMKNDSSFRTLPLIPYIEKLLLQERKNQEVIEGPAESSIIKDIMTIYL